MTTGTPERCIDPEDYSGTDEAVAYLSTINDKVDGNHLAWLLWFVMRNGEEQRMPEKRIWAYEHIGVGVEVEQWADKPQGTNIQAKGMQHVRAKGEKWSLKFSYFGGTRLQLDEIKGANHFWRDLCVMRLCDA